MRHLVSGRKLNRTASHRKAMLSNLAISILDKERVTTTLVKAKEVRSVVERLITYGKKGDLHAIRLAARRINNKTVLKKLFDDIAPTYKDREGGYTRIVKVGERKGDNAMMSIIELVGRNGQQAVRKRKKKTSKSSAPVAAQVSGASEGAQSESNEANKE
jgi:large subunit ribosomal protein L17